MLPRMRSIRETRHCSVRGRTVMAAILMLCMASGALAAGGEERRSGELPIPSELWEAANHGRIPLREDGYFRFPPAVKKVVIDVGAHILRFSRPYLRKAADTGVVAIEPLRESWARWPDNRRLVGVPAAISPERGTISFNVNSNPVTSSVLGTAEGGLSAPTVEIRRVPSLRLEDVLRRVPPGLDVFLLKTDVQGFDLAVLMSGGDALRRVSEVVTEIDLSSSYVGGGPGENAPEAEYDRYMESKGFKRIPGKADEYLRDRKLYIDAVYRRESTGVGGTPTPAGR